jgi:hypothetical protein
MDESKKTFDFPIIFMPSGKPAPAIMTAEETAQFLRLENGDSLRTLKYFRDERQLVGFRLGRKVRYRLADVLEFVAKKSREKQDN